MYTKTIVTTLLLITLTQAFVPLARSIGGSCTNDQSVKGVCVKTDDCTKADGKYDTGNCPNDPTNVKCCVKTNCGPSNNGKCQFTSTSCSGGSYKANYCPGGDDFKCCVPDSSGGGSGGQYPTPDLPSESSGCKKTAIAGAKKIIGEFPGEVKEIGCIRKCDDPSSSDHCTGTATDMMVAPGGVSESDRT